MDAVPGWQAPLFLLEGEDISIIYGGKQAGRAFAESSGLAVYLARVGLPSMVIAAVPGWQALLFLLGGKDILIIIMEDTKKHKTIMEGS